MTRACTDRHSGRWGLAARGILAGVILASMVASPADAHHRYRHHRHAHHWHRAVQQFSPAPPPMVFAQPFVYHPRQPCNSLDDCDRKDYDESGTRGRMGLGASPYHPEGPGNATD